MTRYTNLGRKRTYMETGFSQDKQNEGAVAADAIPSNEEQTNDAVGTHSVKKRKRTKCNAKGGGAPSVVISENEGTNVSKRKEEKQEDSEVKKAYMSRDKNRADEAPRAALSEQRRQKRIQGKLANTTCFACRDKGHAAKDCPTVRSRGDDYNTSSIQVGNCYRCGSSKHTLSRCRKAETVGNPLPFASCFLCSGKGHLVSSCPKNEKKGVYPNGGCCKLCGETSHLARNCHLRKQVHVLDAVFVGTGHDAGADEDDFHTLKRMNAEVDMNERVEARAKKKTDIKVGVVSKTIKSFATTPPPSRNRKYKILRNTMHYVSYFQLAHSLATMEDESYGMPPPSAPSRSIDVELGGQEVVTIELDTLDSDPRDYIDLLIEGNAKVSIWTRLACEYWKKGLLESAQQCAESAIDLFKTSQMTSSLPPIYQLLANIQLARARKAPKMILDNPRQDDLRAERLKESFHQYAARYLNSGDGMTQDGGDKYTLNAVLTRGIYHLARTELDDAFRSFEAVLSQKPTNVVALLGKARIAYARKQYSQALRLFQQVLQMNPNAQPDPRIGIGLCFWAMDQKIKAKACWERSLEVNPSNWAACLLLGLEAINNSKNPDDDDDDRTENLIKGTKYCERAFNGNNRNAAAANALFEYFLRKGDKKRALKLAERTIQFAETLTLFSAGHIHAGHLAQMDDSVSDAMRHFNAALKSNPKNMLAAIGLAQAQLKNDEIPAAIHTLDSLMQPPNPQRCLEAQVMLASLRASPRPGVSSADAAVERIKARDLFEHVLKALDLTEPVRTNGSIPRSRSNSEIYAHRKAIVNFGDDVELLIEAARLWQDDDRPRMRRMLEEAVRIVDARVRTGGAGEPRLLNNHAVLKHLDGELAEARVMYEIALTEASAIEGAVGEGMATTILFNLARVYEDQGEVGIAKEAYNKLLGRHPEYVDAKVRQAQLFISLSQYDEAHELLKSALTSQKQNLNIRGALAHFLASRQQLKLAREILAQTLNDFGGLQDVYCLCASAWVFFTQARENRDASPAGMADRRKFFMRAADFYERALQLDPKCAFAAQGLAIISAEDSLSPLKAPGLGSPEEAMRRVQGAREALDIFGKVRESLNDSSVYVNMGHCYVVRDELDRAIESYETAAKRSAAGRGVDVTALHCLCRAWYAKANKDQSFTALSKALIYAQRALHIAPHEKSNVYNLAMIEQKAAEMLFATAPAKRTLTDLKHAVEQGAHAQKLFASLASDKSPSVPYSRDIADQRRKYGESLLRRADEHMGAQDRHETAQETRQTEARQRRQEEKARAEAAGKVREHELEQQARLLAEERRKARSEAQQWSAAFGADSEEEKEKRPRKGVKKQQRGEGGSGDEAPVPTSDGKKKRKGKLKKERGATGGEGEGSGGEEEALFSGREEVEDRPKKRVQKKRVVRDDDEEETAASLPRKKQFKSKETISDSDEEMS